MEDRWIDRLSEYMDDELAAPERAEIESHLTSCRECASTLEELRAVTARASRLAPQPPSADLWPGVEARLDPIRSVVTPFQTRVTRRFSFTMPQLVAAGLALMVMSGGGVWVLQHGGRATDLPPVVANDRTDPSLVPAAVADPRYDEAVADLEEALEQGRAALDPATIRVIEESLSAIDKAIDESRRALAIDPANVYLHSHLAHARQRKLALLRRGLAMVELKS